MKIKLLLSLILVIVLTGCTSTGNPSQDLSDKTRIVIVTDLGGIEPGVAFDPDDTESMVHLLVCSDVVDIEGIVTGMAWTTESRRNGIKHVNLLLDQFAEVQPNLQKHSDGYPSIEYLRSITKEGSLVAHMDGVGEGKDTPGSEHIIAVVDKDDSRPVWLTTWAGMSPIAQALWKVKNTRSEEDFKKFASKIRIFDVLGQDDCGAWVAKNFPEIPYIRHTKVYGWTPEDEWFVENVQNIGPFGKAYPSRIWSWEGDTPGFLYFLANGLNVPEHPEYGGWGGRFNKEKSEGVRGMRAAFNARTGKSESIYDPYYMTASAEEGVEAIKMWKDEILNDFAARMLWTATPDYSSVNHHPRAVIGNDRSLHCIYKKVKAGDCLKLNAAKSTDPDKDDLKWEWSLYPEAGTYEGEITIEGKDTEKCRIYIPQDADGKTIHIILKVTDNGIPELTSYRRVVVEIDNTVQK
ncbi:MAG: nucleoside hydrolase-like domain-containing protein [Candidatus Cryptobacteroides sp.]